MTIAEPNQTAKDNAQRVLDMAAAAGLTFDRVRNDADGGVSLTVERGPLYEPGSIFCWVVCGNDGDVGALIAIGKKVVDSWDTDCTDGEIKKMLERIALALKEPK